MKISYRKMDKNIKYRDGVPSNAVPAGVVKFFDLML